MFRFLGLCFVLAALPAAGAQLLFDFGSTHEGQTPPGFRSAVTGQGKPGRWSILLDKAPSAFVPQTPEAAQVARQPVLAQLSQDPTDEHFPLLIYEKQSFGDFTLTTKFKTVSGVKERMAGIAFRLQNETNYYVVRASSLGNTFRFYKVVNGQRGTIIGPELPISTGVWHELGVTCSGSQIRCFLDGKQVIPTITDTSFSSGKFAFWTKSDSVSYFSGTKIVYTPEVSPAQVVVGEMVKEYRHLVGLRIYIAGKKPGTTRLAASQDKSELGRPGGKVELDVLRRGVMYFGRGKRIVVVTMPLRDRNGDVIGAARVSMKTFLGQTEKNAVERAAPLVRELESRIESLQDLKD
jgi:3-keto-disaccharide hydrolase